MRLIQCLCDKCSCASDCEYYEETVEPIINAVTKSVLYDDEFTARIKDVLEAFQCEYFEQ